MKASSRLGQLAAGLLLGGALLLAGCQSAPPRVPAAITSRLSKTHRAVPGTHVLLDAPTDFKLQADERMLRRNDANFVQVMEMPGVRFADYLAVLRRQVDSARQDLPAEALQQTTFNGLPAVFLTQPYARIPGMEAALLAFGDSSRLTLLVGVYPRVLPGARQEVRQVLLTACYNPRLPVAGDNASFQLDLTGTGYQRTAQAGRWTVYRPTAEPITDSAHASMFRVMLLPPVSSRSRVQDLALSLIREYRTVTEVDNVQETNNLLDGNYAYQNVVSFSHEGKKGQALIMLISTPQAVIVVDGRAYDRHYEHVLQYWKLARKIRVGEGPLS